MSSPEATAKWVLETMGIARAGDIPAARLAEIADREGLKSLHKDYPMDSWDGMLLFTDRPRAILVNTYRGNSGRHHFTFAHELGHYFMGHEPSFSGNGQRGFRCTVENGEKAKPRAETEANRFAVELLMPEDQFRLDMSGAPIDFVLIGSLASKYLVSKHASSNRILSLTHTPCVIVRTRGTKIDGWTESRSARGFFRPMGTVPEGTTAHHVITYKRWQKDFEACDASLWLRCAVPSSTVFECTHSDYESGVAMTILRW